MKLHYFAGPTNAEAAVTPGIPPTTAKLWWRYAGAWLLREIGSGGP